MKKLLLMGTMLLMSFTAFADIGCDLKVDKNIYTTKRFKAGTSTIDLGGDVRKCSVSKAMDHAISKCIKAGYNNCHVLDYDSKGIIDMSGETNFFERCTAIVEGRKVKAQKSAEKVQEEKCEKIRECADKKTKVEDLEVLSQLIVINKC